MTRPTCAIQASGSIELLFYGELPDAERFVVTQHLRTCAECRSTLDELGVIRSALASRPDIASPPGGNWSSFMTRLESAIGSSAASVVPFEIRHAVYSPRRSMVPYLAMAALLALVTMSVVFVARQTPQGETAAGTPAPAIAPAGRESAVTSERSEPDPALAALSEQHFKRSKLVVLGLTTKDASAVGPADWAYERELASTLLSDTRLYRRAAEQHGMNAIAGVMRDLELVLLQTSMAEAPDAASLEQIQRLIRRRDLVTKMEVVNSAGLVP
jgi:hypothetical protein